MKKNSLPAIVIWAFYALASGCFLFLTMLNICGEAGIGPGTGLVVGAGVLALLGTLVFLLNFFVQKSRGSSAGQKHRHGRLTYQASLVIEGIVALILIVFMVLLRKGYPTDAYPWYISSSKEYALAQIGTGTELPDMAHKGRELYVWLLRDFCFLLGNRPQTVVFFQLLLLVIAAICVYFGVRRGAGEIAAMIVLAFLGFSPYMIAETSRPSPLLLILIFYGIGLKFIAELTEQRKENRIRAVIYYVVTGLVIGFCCYLDMAGITLLIFLTGELCFSREGKNDMDSNPLFAFLICLISAVVGYFVYHGIRGSISGTMGASIHAQLGLYLPQRFSLAAGTGRTASWDMIILAVLMALGIFSFWIDHRIRTKGIWLFAAALLTLMQGFRMGKTEYFNAYALLYLMGAAMAGIGIEYLRLWLHKMHSHTVENKEGDADGMDFAMQQIEKTEELEVEIMDQNENGSDKKKDFQYIENPLPVPKKRERKAMDYDYEVSDDDDFDIP